VEEMFLFPICRSVLLVDDVDAVRVRFTFPPTTRTSSIWAGDCDSLLQFRGNPASLSNRIFHFRRVIFILDQIVLWGSSLSNLPTLLLAVELFGVLEVR
jgi:hypothetical protein